MRKIIMALVAAGALAGCVSKKRYDDLVLEQQRVSEQKDSLGNDVLILLPHRQAQLQFRHMLHAVAAVQGRGDLCGRVLATAIAQCGQLPSCWAGSRGDCPPERGGGADHGRQEGSAPCPPATAPRKRR
jgi:outer membrane murein-binding lipoprotein Lpp